MRAILFLLLFCGVSCFAQTTIKWEPKEKNPLNLPTDDQGEIQLRDVVPIPKLTSAGAVKKARAWAAIYYPSANDMVQELDTARGLMIIKGIIKQKQGSTLAHTLVFEAKEGRYRATINKVALVYEVTTPVKLIREIPVHTYGWDADDYYNMYLFVTSSTGANMGFTNFKKISVKAADNQHPFLNLMKQSLEATLASLKKAVEADGDW